MRLKPALLVSFVTLVTAACSSSEPLEVVEQIVVREPGDPEVEASASDAQELDLVAMGEDVFQRCAGCHVVEKDARFSAGPNLHGVFGRVAGSAQGFPFSDAMAASEITWDEESMDRFLADPNGTIPGSDMAVGTVTDADDRAAIIAFLASKSE